VSSCLRTHGTQSYGLKGKAIILGVLMKKFPLSIGRLRPHFSITVLNFLDYVLSPHVAMCLIQQDLELSDNKEAYLIMLESSDFGNRAEHNDDKELERILDTVSNCSWHVSTHP
jgi:hypothetical protein